MPKQVVIGTCKMCLRNDVQLVQSHIIPQSFYEPLKGEEGNKPVVIVDGKKRAIFSQSGVYEYIVCQ